MLTAAFVVTILIQIGLPLLLGAWLIRRYGTSWRLFAIGIITFIGSQVVHIPLLSGLTYVFREGILPAPGDAIRPFFNPIVLGLAAGLCEETARWVGYKLLRGSGKSRTWGGALTLGAGHGGVESMAVGVSVLITLVMSWNLLAVSGLQPLDVLAGAVERILAITLHLTLSVMVWMAFVRRNWLWWLLAVVWHSLVNAVSVWMLERGTYSGWEIEGVLAVLVLISLVFLWGMRRLAKNTLRDQFYEPAPEAEPAAPVEDLPAAEPLD